MMAYDIKQNPNEEELKDIIEAVEANDGYCPCALEKNEDTKCMCKTFRESPDTDFCHCGRFYKIRDYETIALLGDTSEDERTLGYMDWFERLTHQDFLVLGIPLNLYSPFCGSENHFNLCKAIIGKADALVVLGHDQKLYPMVMDLVEWAGAIGKKILTREDLVK